MHRNVTHPTSLARREAKGDALNIAVVIITGIGDYQGLNFILDELIVP